MEESLRRSARLARAEIAAGARGARVIELVRSIPVRDRDAWCDELLGLELPPPDAPLPRGSVPYLPCSIDDIVTTVLEVPVRAGDVLVDLGSGVGRAVMLVHLLSGARAHGIEIQTDLVERARAHSRELGLTGAVTFTHADASASELDGSIFFLYAPCNGEMLVRLFARLEDVARKKPIVVAAVGLDIELAWLRARTTRSASAALTIYDSQH